MMAKKLDGSTKVTALRRQAEERLRITRREIQAMPVKDLQHLVHELQVHQIELEMQNDELHRTHMALEEARDRYVTLYDYAPNGYLTLDHKGVILEANLPACALLGVTRKDLLGQPVIGFVMPKDQAMVLSHLRELVNTGTRQAYEVSLAQRDDVPVLVRFESVAVQDNVGQHTHVLTALMDLTERTRAEVALMKYQHGLARQQRLEEREWLGHDLHDGILQSLYGIGLSLDRARIDLSGVSDNTSVMLGQNVDAVNSVMREVRTFIQELESESQPKTALPALELRSSLRILARMLAKLHGRQVRVSVARAVATGMSHAQRLEILKLAKEALSNSFRHTQANLVSVSLNRVKNNFRLTVQDNGAGFHTNAKKGKGHGLISMAARAKQLGGTLSVQSRPRKGTTVTLDIPQNPTA
jgi:PAS domain S-box-containing protein